MLKNLHADGGARGSQQVLDECVQLSIAKPEASGPEDVSALEAMQAWMTGQMAEMQRATDAALQSAKELAEARSHKSDSEGFKSIAPSVRDDVPGALESGLRQPMQLTKENLKDFQEKLRQSQRH